MATPGRHCALAYPERFYAAFAFAQDVPDGAAATSDAARLLLYALYQQATAGPCNVPKPWAWNTVEWHKWNAWSELGSLSSLEAMRLYVRALEQDNPDWWRLLTDDGKALRVAAVTAAAADAAAAAAEARTKAAAAAEAQPEGKAPDEVQATVLAPLPGTWVTLPVGGARPRRRYEHVAVTLPADSTHPEAVMLYGGSSNGRSLGDAHLLALPSLIWSPLPLTPVPPLPRAGAAAVAWRGCMLLVSGVVRDGGRSSLDAPAEVLQLRRDGECAVLACGGAPPPARSGVTATLLGSTLWLFGGEDAKRRPTADVAALQLDAPGGPVWLRLGMAAPPPPAPKATKAAKAAAAALAAGPEPRTGHVAAGCGSRWLFVFGGTLASGNCTASLWALDTHSPLALRWAQPSLSDDSLRPAPRAGAAAATLDNALYVTGGGDGMAPRAETLALALAPPDAWPLRWAAAAGSGPEAPPAAEGASLAALPSHGALLAFGGYNGSYSDACMLLCPIAPPAPAPCQEPVTPEKAAPQPEDEPVAPPAPVAQAVVTPAVGAPAAHTEAPEVAELRRQLAAAAAALDVQQMRATRAEVEATQLRAQLAAAREEAAEAAASAEAAKASAADTEAPRKGSFFSYVTGQ